MDEMCDSLNKPNIHPPKEKMQPAVRNYRFKTKFARYKEALHGSMVPQINLEIPFLPPFLIVGFRLDAKDTRIPS
jgi:hypothetical protein